MFGAGVFRVAMPRKAVIVGGNHCGEAEDVVPWGGEGFHGRDEVRGDEASHEGPTVEGYIKFLVDSKVVYDTLENIVEEAPHPFYVEFRNTGLERSGSLAKDLEWLKEQGHPIPGLFASKRRMERVASLYCSAAK